MASLMNVPAPSAHQTAILDWIATHEGGALVVEAVAGSGKTTTLRMIAGALRDKGIPASEILYLAFGKDLCNEVAPKLAGLAQARTIHSHGFEGLRKAFRGRLDFKKGDALREQVLGGDPDLATLGKGERAVREWALMDLLSKALVSISGTSLPEVEYMVDHYGIDLDAGWAQPRLERLMGASVAMSRRGVHSFDDMIAMPAREGLAVGRYPVVLVDEAQDLSPAQRAVALASVATGGMVIFVGDPRQAIFGFAGATCESIDEIVEATGADVLPLSVTYRCPASHVAMAQRIVPAIQAAPGAAPGTLVEITREEVPSLVQRGDLMICRRTAPVISMAFRLIANGIAAKVKGRDIGKGLVVLARKVAGKAPMAQFLSRLDSHMDRQRALLATKPIRLQMEQDKADALEVIVASQSPASLDDLVVRIDGIFNDDGGVVTLSTIHKAKGLEADRVFLLDVDRVQLPARTEWQAKQEANLHYVALTRSKEALYLVP